MCLCKACASSVEGRIALVKHVVIIWLSLKCQKNADCDFMGIFTSGEVRMAANVENEPALDNGQWITAMCSPAELARKSSRSRS